MLNDIKRDTPEDILNCMIVNNYGQLIRVGDVTDLTYTTDMMQLDHLERELNIRLINFINEQHGTLITDKGFPEFAALDVVGDIVDFFAAQLGVPQARHRVVLVEALLRAHQESHRLIEGDGGFINAFYM